MARHPVDYDQLKKGDTISIEDLEVILNERRGTSAFQLGLLGLTGDISREMVSRGLPVTIETRKSALHICTDKEAAVVNNRRFRNKAEGMIRDHGRQMLVDQNNLDARQKRIHNRAMEVNGRYLQGMLNVQNTLRLKAHERITPGLPEPSPQEEDPGNGPLEEQTA